MPSARQKKPYWHKNTGAPIGAPFVMPLAAAAVVVAAAVVIVVVAAAHAVVTAAAEQDQQDDNPTDVTAKETIVIVEAHKDTSRNFVEL